MKKKFLYVMALAALVSCSSDEFVGEGDSPNTGAGVQRPISFGGATSSSSVTRSDKYGSEAAGVLNNQFVVYGYKTVSASTQTVFDNYQVNYVDATAHSTESNSAGWEYVSYKNLPFGTTATEGGTLNTDGVTKNASGSSTNVEQSIKYWDFSATRYDFFAYSLGAGEPDNNEDADTDPQYAKASRLSNSTYTLEGNSTQLGACYISKKNSFAPSTSKTEVDLEFLSFLSKVQLKFYETIPGYSVKNLKFYVAENTKSTGDADNDGLAPALYTASTIPTAGSYTITFNGSAPVVTLSSATTSVNNIVFPAVSTGPNVWLSGYVGKDYEETEETVYLGRTSNTATSSKQTDVLPNSTGAVLTLKMDYTLLSRDRSGETIQITGATATIPADYTKWKPNYAYTYIFKISDNTNGQTGGDITGLYPITLDAIVTESEDGSQTTITTVATPSITTYQSGAIANEYNAGNIYVVVGDGSTVLTAGTNAKLYTATIEEGAAQGIAGDGSVAITEEMVANALTKSPDGSGNYVLTDANGKDLTVTPVSNEAADKLVGALTAIPAADAPGGKELAVKCASFAAANNKVYVFEYIYDTDKKAYKVIKVGTPTVVTP